MNPLRRRRIHQARSLRHRAVAWWDARYHNGGEYLGDISGSGAVNDLQLGSTAGADTNDPLFLPWTGDNYVYFPGSVANYLSTPDSASFAPFDDFTFIFVREGDWRPAAIETPMSQDDAGVERSWNVELRVDGTLRISLSTDGAAFTTDRFTSAAIPDDDAKRWVKIVRTTASSKIEVFLSTDGTSYSQLGADILDDDTSTLFNSTADVTIGMKNDGTTRPMSGRLYRVRVFSDSTETTEVFDWNPDASFTVDQANSAAVTINRSTAGAKCAEIESPEFLFAGDDYAITSASPITAYPFTLAAKVRGYGTAAIAGIIALVDASADNVQYGIRADGSGNFGVRARNTTAWDAYESGTQYDDGSWHAVVAVFRSATDREVYIDGVSVATDANSVTFNAAVDRLSVGAFAGATPDSHADAEEAMWAAFDAALSIPDILGLNTEFGI